MALGGRKDVMCQRSVRNRFRSMRDYQRGDPERQHALFISPCLPWSGQVWGLKSSLLPEWMRTHGYREFRPQAAPGALITLPACCSLLPLPSYSRNPQSAGSPPILFVFVTPVLVQGLTLSNHDNITVNSYIELSMCSGSRSKYFTYENSFKRQ